MEEAMARLAAIVSTSSDAIVSKTLEGIITSWNESAARMFGYTAEEIIGQPILRLIPPELQFEEEQILARLKAGERLEHYETVRVTKDGRRLNVSLTISPLKNSAGQIIGASKIARDITERKQAEEALRRGHQRLQMVLRVGRMGWWERDLQTGEMVWSDSFYDLLGQGAQTTRPSYELFLQQVYPEDRQKIQDKVRRAMVEGGEYSGEYRLLHPNGGIRWVLEKGQVFYDQADQPQRIVGVSLDITQRKWVEEGLRESEAILRSFYDNTSLLLGLVELAEDDIVHLYDNPAMHRFYGLQTGQSTTGQRASQLGMPPAAIQAWLSYFKASEASGQPVQFEYVHDSPHGPRWLAATVAVIASGFSGRNRFCYVAEDVTERKRVEVG
jgi:PAS domain S-box-containing protein